MRNGRSPDPIECLKYGWALYLREPLLFSAATLVAIILNMLVSFIPFAGLLVYPLLLAGMYIIIMRVDESTPVTVTALFDGLPQFVPLVLASLATSLLITLGLFLLVLPGLYLALAYGFTTLLIIDRRLDFWPAMETSRKTITTHLLGYFLLALLMLGICFIGSIPFGLGLLVAIPVSIAAQYRFYTQVI